MEKQEQLTFKDFEMASNHKYDHTKDSTWEAIGATEKDVERLQETMVELLKNEKTISEFIEKSLKIDLPAPYKAWGFMKSAEIKLKSQLHEIITGAPDQIPMGFVKPILLMALKNIGV